MIKIALDAMGGDYGPEPIIEGLLQAFKLNTDFHAFVVGKKNELTPLLPRAYESKITIIEADDVISMHDTATDALKRKKVLSIKQSN